MLHRRIFSLSGKLLLIGMLLAVVLLMAGAIGTATAAPSGTDTAYSAEDPSDSTLAAQLSPGEAEGLAFMREEEKLARDVYLTLYEQWGLPIFQNIAGSEQTHMDAILRLLEPYGLADPAAGHDRGEFTNPDLQSLYDQLVDQGQQSLAGALEVGGAIEEIDILDLQERMAATDNEAILRVYGNLLAGSENHLRAFASTLERQTGEQYQPAYLSQEAFLAIINEPAGRGNGNGGRNGANAAGRDGAPGNGRGRAGRGRGRS